MNPLIWILLLAMQALFQGASLTAAPAALASSDLSQRQAQWQRLRILDVDADGLAWRRDEVLNTAEQRRVYLDSDAHEAEALWRAGRAKTTAGVLWMLAIPAGGMALGAVLGQELDSEAKLQDHRSGKDYDPENPSRYQTLGVASGAVLGLILGGTILYFKGQAAVERRRDAAESYNRGLLQDLGLSAAPTRGGLALGLSGRF